MGGGWGPSPEPVGVGIKKYVPFFLSCGCLKNTSVMSVRNNALHSPKSYSSTCRDHKQPAHVSRGARGSEVDIATMKMLRDAGYGWAPDRACHEASGGCLQANVVLSKEER